MKLGGLFVLVLGIAMFPTCSAQIGPSNLWEFNSPIDFTVGTEEKLNYWDVWKTNSPLNFTPGAEVDKGINTTSGIDKGINLTPGIDQGITLTPGVDQGITLTPGIDQGITLTSGTDKGFTIKPEFAAKVW